MRGHEQTGIFILAKKTSGDEYKEPNKVLFLRMKTRGRVEARRTRDKGGVSAQTHENGLRFWRCLREGRLRQTSSTKGKKEEEGGSRVCRGSLVTPRFFQLSETVRKFSGTKERRVALLRVHRRLARSHFRSLLRFLVSPLNYPSFHPLSTGYRV